MHLTKALWMTSTLLEMMQENNPSMFNFIREKINEDIRMAEDTEITKRCRGFLRYVEGGRE